MRFFTSFSASLRPPRALLALAWFMALSACALPPMIGHVLLPVASVTHQVAALLTWAGLALLLCLGGDKRGVTLIAGAPVFLILVLLAAGISWSIWINRFPLSLALLSYGALLATTVLFVVGLAARQQGHTRTLLSLLATGWALLGLLLAGVCFIQVLAPQLADGDWIANSSLPGRAIGNMRQPNHTAMLLCWSCVAVLWLSEATWLSWRWAFLLFALFVGAIVLTASRTGMLGLMLLAAWGASDRLLSACTRRLLLGAPVLLAAAWLLMQGWASWSEQGLGATARLAEGAGSPSRLAIWADAIELLWRYPLTGVGWGEFNLAWTLTDLPRRSPVAFDHVHNLPLQLLVELGLPLGLVGLLALWWSGVRAWRSMRAASRDDAVALRFAAMILMLVCLHSLLEYPLWYMYFLLPTALLLGVCMGRGGQLVQHKRAPVAVPMRTLACACAWVMASGAAMFVDYLRVVPLYASDRFALPEQMERGQDAWLFGTWADYVYALHFPDTARGLVAAGRTAHLMSDAQSLMAWSKALHAAGDADRAAFLSKRLREFKDPLAKQWFEPCESAVLELQKPPFQCAEPGRDFTYRDFL